MRDVEIRYNEIIILVYELNMQKPDGWREYKKNLLIEGKAILDNEEPAGFHKLPSISERRLWLKTLVEEKELEDLLMGDSDEFMEDFISEEDFMEERMFYE